MRVTNDERWESPTVCLFWVVDVRDERPVPRPDSAARASDAATRSQASIDSDRIKHLLATGRHLVSARAQRYIMHRF